MSFADAHMLKARSDWFRHIRSNDESKLRLFCFPYAGSGPSIFSEWPADISKVFDVMGVIYPGRESLSSQAPLNDLSDIVEKIFTNILPYLDRPFAFFGHSMGAYVSYELAKQLKERQGLSPEHLFLSGASAPHIVNENPVHALPPSEFLRALIELNGFPLEVLQSPELVHLALPLLRADFTSCETYHYTAGQPIDTPMTALGGDNDPRVAIDELEAWQHHSTAMFSSQVFKGDHFYLREHQSQLVSSINQELLKAIS